MDSRRLEKIKDVMKEMIDAQYTMGMLCIVIKDGKEEFYHEIGYRDSANKHAFTRDTLCHMYSLTKVVTSVATMILIEDGTMSLDDPVEKFLPSYEGKNLTIENLLNMTSGIPYPDSETRPSEKGSGKIMREVISKMDTDEAYTTRQIADMYAEIPFSFNPGASWEYGMSADILGAVIEAASGQKYSAFLKQRIFDPLGMKDTGFFVPREKLGRMAVKYLETAEGLKVYDRYDLCVNPSPTKEPAFISGGAGLISTADDYIKLLRMLLYKGKFNGVRILSEKTVNFMTTPRLNDEQKKNLHTWDSLSGFSYGNLLRVLENTGQAKSLGIKGEYGWDSWTGCYSASVPEENMIVLLMQQRVESGTGPYVHRIRNIIFSAID